MRLQSRTWLVISLLCFAGAVFFWRLGMQRDAARHLSNPPVPARSAALVPKGTPARLLSAPPPRVAYTGTNRFSEPPKSRYPHRLHNSDRPLDALVHSDQGLLLANALIDTARPLELAIPDSLRLQGDTASYVVQARGVITDTFRRLLTDAGATIVSYVPNNALLVRIDPSGAARIALSPLVQSALPWEPYFKLEPRLLDTALSTPDPARPVDPDLDVSLVVFPGERDAATQALDRLGFTLLGETASPFGPQLSVRVPRERLADLARVDVAQYLETRYVPHVMNDLTRVSLGISTNGGDTSGYLGLTGTNVVVNINDTGVDDTHPDLAGRVTHPNGVDVTDFDGHGTHVAGIIASSGLNGPAGTNAPGSATNANFMGKAPAAKLFVLPLFLGVGPANGDRYLQEMAANTNAPISHNSWGYIGAYGYTLNSASYDAAVRDALPSAPGEQPILYVFSAGNDGEGDHTGEGGFADTISSPGNSKNVITVGALESFRRITNSLVTQTDTNLPPTTNSFFLTDTDSDDQVAYYSSRGNVGRTVEGEAGRFKPDVVAPGSFIVSTRALNPPWIDPTTATETFRLARENQVAAPHSTNIYGLTVPDETIRLFVRALPNFRSPDPMPNLHIAVRKGDVPPPPADVEGENFVTVDPASGGDWTLSIINTNDAAVPHDLVVVGVVTNGSVSSDYFKALKDINDPLAPNYRFETGTSMAAPAISGLMALLYEFLHDRLQITNPSPALMKAMLINSTKPVHTRYDRAVAGRINYQGWGRPDIRNMIPEQMDVARKQNDPSVPMWFLDQSPTNALATGESFTRIVTILEPEAMLNPLKITLVWTDPPGNPAVGIKLVNDLDLVVTNLDTGDIYYGNDIPKGSDVVMATDTNSVANIDVVNNVENVFLSPPLGERFSVTVRAKRVNVNASTGQPDKIAQDFALVVASADSTLINVFDVADPGAAAADNTIVYKELTNGIPLLKERVGANPPRVAAPGDPRQWNFYKFVNVGSTNPYVAIITFQPPNLSRLRMREADIDLYVSTDPAITNLDATAVANADVSRNRGGTEFVTYSNSPPDSVYYVGVKSEDQQGSEFALVAIATNEPFDRAGPGGARVVRLLPMPLNIPDGSSQQSTPADATGIGLMFGVSRIGSMIQNVVLTNIYDFENEGDIAAFLHHSGTPSVDITLSPHSVFTGPGPHKVIYDDGGYNFAPKSIPTEGPGRLTSLIGQQMNGVWQMRVFDNSPFHTGRVTQATLYIKPMDTNCFGQAGCVITIPPHSWSPPLPFEIEPDVTEADFCVSGNNNPLDMYVGMPQFPTPDDYYAYQKIDQSPSECLTLSYYTTPIIKIGKGITRIFNPNDSVETFTYRVTFIRGLLDNRLSTFVWTNGPAAIASDARLTTTLNVPTNRTIIDLRVGVRLDHPTVSDLVLTLVSPQGTRWLLSENRGGLSQDGLGFNLFPPPFPNTAESLLTNYSWVTFTDNTNAGDSLIKFAAPPFKSLSLLPQPQDYFDGFDAIPALPPAAFVEGDTFGAWKVLTNGVMILNHGALASSPPNVLALSDGRISTLLPTHEGREYALKFAHRKASSAGLQEIIATVAALTNTPVDLTGGTILPATPLTKVRVCPGQIVELETTNRVVINGGGFEVDALGIVGSPFRGLALNHYALVGQWSSSAVELTPRTISSAPFVVGPTNSVQAPSAPGDYYLWLAINDENPLDNSGAFDVTVRWQSCQLDAFQFVLDGVTNTVFPADNWQTNTVKFLATASDEELVFQPLWNATTLLDSIQLLEPISTRYYTAEEKLEASTALQYSSGSGEFAELPAIRGEPGLGDWKLEIWDNRSTPAVVGPQQLLSWYLQILFAPTQQGLPLTNCLPYVGDMSGSQVRYFEVRVPREAVSVKNTLLGPDVALIYNRDSVPDGVSDPFIPGGNVFTVDLVSPPSVELVPGGHYYLGVVNLNPSSTNNPFSLRIDMELPMTTLVHGVPLTALGANYAAITNTFTYTTNLAAVTNVLYPGTNLHWYKFVVDPSDTLDGVLFELQSTNRSLHLVASHGDAVVDYLPRPTHYDYHSINFDNDREVIIVRTNSYPTPLTAIPWVLGVYSEGTNNGFYQISATRWTNPPPAVVVPLPGYAIATNWTATTNELGFSLLPGESQNFFYQFVTDPTNTAVVFEIYNLNGDVDLLVRREVLPGMALYDFSDLQYGTNSEHVSIHTNIFLPTLGVQTNWFLNLVNHDFLTVTGSLHVATATAGGVLESGLPLSIDLTGTPTFVGNGLVIQWKSLAGEHYDIEAADAALGPFGRIATVVATSSTTRYVETNPPAGPRFYRVVQVPP